MSLRARLGSLALLLSTPFLLGARGCIDELSVGVRTIDTGGTTDAGDDDSGLGHSDSDGGDDTCCGLPAPPTETCWDGSPQLPVCAHLHDGCVWEYGSCPHDGDSAVFELVPVCNPDDCAMILTRMPVSLATSKTQCLDGEPRCVRQDDLLCTYQCTVEVPCSADNPSCAKDQFCAYNLGSCGAIEDSGFCKAVPESCAKEELPVCGCDGITYANACEALRAGVSVAFEARCERDPPLCPSQCDAAALDSFQSLAPEACTDSVYARGPTCLEKADGSCSYQWLECPRNTGKCMSEPASEKLASECWADSDCGELSSCKDALACPCGSSCFYVDRPGHCVPQE